MRLAAEGLELALERHRRGLEGLPRAEVPRNFGVDVGRGAKS